MPLWKYEKDELFNAAVHCFGKDNVKEVSLTSGLYLTVFLKDGTPPLQIISTRIEKIMKELPKIQEYWVDITVKVRATSPDEAWSILNEKAALLNSNHVEVKEISEAELSATML